MTQDNPPAGCGVHVTAANRAAGLRDARRIGAVFLSPDRVPWDAKAQHHLEARRAGKAA